MKYQAIVSDIDGTLIDDERNLSTENYQAIQQLIADGGHFVLASGRPDAGMHHIAQECGLADKEGFLIAYNGGKIMRTDTREVLFSKGISHTSFSFFYDYAQQKGLSICSYTDEHIITNKLSEHVQTEIDLTKMNYLEVTNMITYFEDKFIPKAIIFGEPELLQDCLAELAPFQEEQDVEVVISNPTFLEITGRNITKGRALHKLASLLDIDISEIIAVGDGGNDLTMIQEAGLGVAVANAAPILKDAADTLTVSNNDSPIAELLKKYFL